MAESISLEETNKIRISLGLKPLTDDAAPADTKEQTAEDNFTKRRQQEAHVRERKYDLFTPFFLALTRLFVGELRMGSQSECQLYSTFVIYFYSSSLCPGMLLSRMLIRSPF